MLKAATENPSYLSAKVPGHYRLIGLFIVFASAAVALLFILRNGANVPYADEFDYVSLEKAIKAGQMSFATLWAPHNEHRIFLARAIFSVLNPIIGWNSLAMMVLSWGVVVGTALVLFQRLTAILDRSKKVIWLALVGVTFLVLFSPIQHENWLWAFQLSFFLAQFGVVLSLFLLSTPSISFPLRVGLAILCAVVASLSSAQGLMVWPALITTIALIGETTRRKLIGSFAVCAVGALICWAYFTNYQTPSVGHLTLNEILHHPSMPCLYFLGLVGAPLAGWMPGGLNTSCAIAFGLILLILFAWFSYRNMRKGLSPIIAPWLGLTVFVAAFCVITTIGRAHFGIYTAAITSRYTTHTLWFTISVLTLGYLALDSSRKLGNDFGEVLGTAVLIAGIWLVVHIRQHGNTITTLLLVSIVLTLGYLTWRWRSPSQDNSGEVVGTVSLVFCIWSLVTTSRHGHSIVMLLLAASALVLGYLVADRRYRLVLNRQDWVTLATISFFIVVSVCVLGGYRDEFGQAEEKQQRLLAKSLLPFLDYFDPMVDGAVKGPFYALCPMPNLRLYDWALKPYAEQGYVRLKQDGRFVGAMPGLSGDYSIDGPANMFGGGVSLSGAITYPPNISPVLVFIKREGESKFIGASRLEFKGTNSNERIARWQLDLAPQFLAGNSKLEVWVYDNRSQAFYLANS